MTTPLILNQLGAELGRAVARHPSRPTVLDLPPGSEPWSGGWSADVPTDGAEILLTGPHPSWHELRNAAPARWPARLRWIQSASVGVDWAPDWMLQSRPVMTCGRGHNSAQVAEYAFAALLDRARGLDRITVRDHAGWTAARAESLPGGTLAGATLGIAGFGSIGAALAERARAFGMRVLAWRRRPWAPGEAEAHGVVAVDGIRALFEASDHLVLALPLTAETRHLVDNSVLRASRPGLHLVNVARGGLVDHAALLRALDENRLGFATLDVTEPEPLPAGHPLYAHRSVRLTPHAAWSGQPDRSRLVEQIHRNLDRFLDGTALRDVVDPLHGY